MSFRKNDIVFAAYLVHHGKCHIGIACIGKKAFFLDGGTKIVYFLKHIIGSVGFRQENRRFFFALDKRQRARIGHLVNRNAPLLSEIFYFPLWLGAGLFVILAVATLVFGVLPAITLLRKTPSEILSKYDI